jgi:hypothetical protein
MGKYLDSIDYNKIVFNTFQLTESDFYKYYANKVKDHLVDNSDMFDELLAAINRRIKWYRDQHSSYYSYDSQKVDKEGQKITVTNILDDWDEADMILIPVYLQDGTFITKVNKPFFDQQIKVINMLSIQHNLKATLNNVRKPSKKKLTFKDLFKNKDNAQIVKDILETKGYTINGEWQGLTSDKSELLAAYYVIKPLLKQGKVTPQARIFYKEFRLEKDYIDERSFRNEPFNNNRDQFETLFSDLLEPSQKK